MLLHDAARYFDNEPLFDGYTGALLFKGQLKNFEDASSIGATIRRRAVSLAPNFSMPERQCVLVQSLRWLSGLGIVETFQGRPIRNSYNLRLATNNFNITTPGKVVGGLAPTGQAYGHAEYAGATIDSKVDSGLDTFYNVYFAAKEPVVSGGFLTTGLRCLRVRQVHLSADLMLVAESDELDDDWSQTALISGLGAYNPITDTEDATVVSVKAIKIDMIKLYHWRNQAEAEAVTGDKVLIVPSTVVPRVGAKVTMGNTTWRVVSFQAELDSWELHIRPV